MTAHSFARRTVVAVDPSRNASAPSAAVTAATEPTTDTAGPTAPGDLSAWDFGCETWLFWNESVDDVDPTGGDPLRGARERRRAVGYGRPRSTRTTKRRLWPW